MFGLQRCNFDEHIKGRYKYYDNAFIHLRLCVCVGCITRSCQIYSVVELLFPCELWSGIPIVENVLFPYLVDFTMFAIRQRSAMVDKLQRRAHMPIADGNT